MLVVVVVDGAVVVVGAGAEVVVVAGVELVVVDAMEVDVVGATEVDVLGDVVLGEVVVDVEVPVPLAAPSAGLFAGGGTWAWAWAALAAASGATNESTTATDITSELALRKECRCASACAFPSWLCRPMRALPSAGTEPQCSAFRTVPTAPEERLKNGPGAPEVLLKIQTAGPAPEFIGEL